jgi:hypothetical protein
VLRRSTRLKRQGSLSTAVIRFGIEIFSGEYGYVPINNVSSPRVSGVTA